MAALSTSWRPRVSLLPAFCLLALLCNCALAPPPGPYHCPDGRQLSPSWVCDGNNDCGDGDPSSDERDCGDTLSCQSTQFMCADGTQCISEQHRCDGDRDCTDGSDESSCPMRPCGSNEFRCGNGRCTHNSYVCDGQDDCGDRSDEEGVECPDLMLCQYRCNGSELCLPNSWVCDGEPDCPNSIDELDCGGVCPFGMFNCSKGGCVKASVVCDGSVDCPGQGDDSDEDCPARPCDLDKEFECHHASGIFECLSRNWLCDGEIDCLDGRDSDEVNCDRYCEETEFSCITGGQCVPRSVQCNGVADCDDGTDEYLCAAPSQIHCRDGQFPCHDGLQCVDASFLCDGTPHCHDDSDQDPQWCDNSQSGVNECAGQSHGCQQHCNDTHYSFYCSCDHGYHLTADRKRCEDINECAILGTCSQVCVNSVGSYQCLCVDGYHEEDNGGCKPISESPGTKGNGYLLLLDKVDIRSVLPNGRQPKKLVRDLAQTYAIDYHLRRSLMFWSEKTYAGTTIKSAFLNGSNVEIIMDTGLKDPQGLAVDWVTDKIYWTDLSRFHITVAELDGSKRRVLFSNDMEKPRGIALDPTTGFMYWTDGGTIPRIERASMDGQNRTVLHSTNLFWPNAITVDYATQWLYWVDARLDFIETSFMDGTQRTVLYREQTNMFRPFGLTLFRETLYLMDFDLSKVMSFHLGPSSMLVDVYEEFVEPVAVVAVHPVRQPLVRLLCTLEEDGYSYSCPDNITEPVTNPCAVANGGCEYMCLLSAVEESGYSCACPTGHLLHDDGRHCLELEMFLLLTDNGEVSVISLDVPHPVDVRIPLEGTDRITSINWDSRTDRIYWADTELHTISSANITGQDQRVVIDNVGIGTPMGVAVDWLHNRLYWTDPEKDMIESSDLDGGQRVIVVWRGLDRPQDIVVHPERGLMFWSDWGDRPKIMRSALDGTQREPIVSEYLNAPNGIAIDYEREIVYWVDGEGDSLEMCDYDGGNRRILIDFSVLSVSAHMYGLAVLDGWLYWTDWRESNLQRANQTTGRDRSELIGDFNQPRDVHVFHRERNHDMITPCSINNGGCSHVCVSRPASTTCTSAECKRQTSVVAACMCPIGYPLMRDGHTCASTINALLLFPTGSAIHQISQDIDRYTADDVVPVPGPSYSVTSVALDPITHTLLWADGITYGVHRMNLQTRSVEVILNEHPISITSLAVDWDSQNLYWVDSYERRVEVARTDGSNRRVLHNGLVNPTGLALDPQSLSLFYVDTGDFERNERPKIYSAAMDGSSRMAIVTSDLGRPLYIAVDNNGANGRIYWTDAYHNRIMSATFQGGDARVVLVFGEDDGASVVHGITFFQDHVYFTDPATNSIWKSDRVGEKSVYLDGYDYLSDIRVVQQNLGVIRGCTNYSRCEYLCLPNPNVPTKQTCSCPTGVEIAHDGSCLSIPNAFLLVGAQHSLRRIALDSRSGDYVDVTLHNSRDGWEVNAVDYLLTAPGEGYMYWTTMKARPGGGADRYRSQIVRADLSGAGTPEVLLTEAGIIEDLAVDWTTGNLYWTVNTGNDNCYIAMADMNGENYRALITSDIRRPRGIALYPLENLMFWTDYGEPPTIERARMDGTGRATIVQRANTFQNLDHPNDIAIDFDTELLYFADGAAGIVAAVTFNGNGRVILNKFRDNPSLRRSQPVTNFIRKPKSLTLRHLSNANRDSDENTEQAELFWSDPEFHGISAVDLVTTGRRTGGIEHSNLRSVLPRTTDYKPMAVQFVSLEGHKPGEISGLSSTPCSEDFCDSLCVNVNSTHFKCLCPNRLTNCQDRVHRSRVTAPPPTTPTRQPTTDTDEPTTVSTTGTTSEQPQPPSTDPNGTETSSSGTSNTRTERTVNSPGSRSAPVKDVGIGMGALILVVLIGFIVCVVVAVVIVRRSKNRYKRHVTRERYKGVRAPQSSFSSPTPPTTPLKSNSFLLPAKQINVTRMCTAPPPPLAARKSNLMQQMLNPPPRNINEYVEEEPEVFELEPVRPRRPKRVPTLSPPDSPLLKPKNPPQEREYNLEAVDSCNSKSGTSHPPKLAPETAKVLNVEPVKPTRSCLSSVSDSSLQKSRLGKNVTFASTSDVSGGESSTDAVPPPPLPPKSPTSECSSDVSRASLCERITVEVDIEGVEEEGEWLTPPPRPPKPVSLGREVNTTESSNQNKCEKEDTEAETAATTDSASDKVASEHGVTPVEESGKGGKAKSSVAVEKEEEEESEGTDKGGCRCDREQEEGGEEGKVKVVYRRMVSDGQRSSDSGESTGTGSGDEATPILA